ncbi:class I SAM-dependent methyltransferase [Rhodopseudomonas sp. P2A-2r]|uniref:class I SAM-dependent methyltransferase n=1 Tax=unclassified Rhodopseudomonas TaxID=2638247 RepID=UPI0022347C45|nr:class I SAM-dependent methyltransferase [Rhodopseudomonas sp. P2A-2r]UZE49219.1 class I SAM-dependent methyltransferase [Rhodopseudomonas sp. P2A-2r]
MAEYVIQFGKDGGRIEADGRLDAKAFHRNHEAIWGVLAPFLGGKSGNVVEVGSGTGQHVVEFAARSPGITWWPSDFNEAHLKSITAWTMHTQRANVRAPLRIDVSEPAWLAHMPEGAAPDPLLAVFCANVVHIAPWPVTEGLLAGAARYLRADGRLFMYGPFKRGGHHTAVSNAVFDTSLRSGNPEWGVRDVEELERVAGSVGLKLIEVVEMPANNLILVFGRIAEG